MATDPRRQPPTSRELCQRALGAFEHLYRLMDADEPDLSANVTFTVGRVELLRVVAAEAWPVDADALAAIIAHIETAERVDDPRTADIWFTVFVRGVLGPIARHGLKGPHASRSGRRRGDQPVPGAVTGPVHSQGLGVPETAPALRG